MLYTHIYIYIVRIYIYFQNNQNYYNQTKIQLIITLSIPIILTVIVQGNIEKPPQQYSQNYFKRQLSNIYPFPQSYAHSCSVPLNLTANSSSCPQAEGCAWRGKGSSASRQPCPYRAVELGDLQDPSQPKPLHDSMSPGHPALFRRTTVVVGVHYSLILWLSVANFTFCLQDILLLTEHHPTSFSSPCEHERLLCIKQWLPRSVGSLPHRKLPSQKLKIRHQSLNYC